VEQMPNISKQLRNFAKGIVSAPARMDAVDKACHVMNTSKSMICAGPRAEKYKKVLCRLIRPIVAFERLTDRRFSGPLPKDPGGRYVPEYLVVWASGLDNEEEYRRKLSGNKKIRGQLLATFWALEEDIESKIRGSHLDLGRILSLVGLSLSPGSFGGLGILLRVEGSKVSKVFIPTGWDAFTNKYFWPQAPSSKFGWTRDLKSRRKGVREVVTWPIQVKDTITPRLAK
jgi:hypothetical protein